MKANLLVKVDPHIIVTLGQVVIESLQQLGLFCAIKNICKIIRLKSITLRGECDNDILRNLEKMAAELWLILMSSI